MSGRTFPEAVQYPDTNRFFGHIRNSSDEWCCTHEHKLPADALACALEVWNRRVRHRKTYDPEYPNNRRKPSDVD